MIEQGHSERRHPELDSGSGQDLASTHTNQF